jgi:hypothetical protein
MATQPPTLPPAIGAHRLVSNGTSAALVTPGGEVDWWCAPTYDDRPLLWALLDPRGAAARWQGTLMVEAGGPPAAPAVRTVLRARDGLVEILDGVVGLHDGGVALVRAVRSLDDGPVELRHLLSIGGFDAEPGVWDGASVDVAGVRVTVGGATSATSDGRVLVTALRADRRWRGLAIAAGGSDVPDFDSLVTAVEDDAATSSRERRKAVLPKRHPERATDALAVLRACTYEPTGAAVASPTTSLPEAPGADRQFDYRYCWLRDAALAVSVAALLGERRAAQRYLRFINETAGGGVPSSPVVTIRGERTPDEREVDGIAGWAGSTPVRVGNAAVDQVQYDALGMVAEAVSVYVQTGGSLDDATWTTVKAIADHMVIAPRQASSGIWELRRPRDLVSADIGRWLALDRAIWIARGWRPRSSRRHWKKARAEARDRVLQALDDDGLLPQAYDGDVRPDAAALLVPLFGMLRRGDDRAGRLIDATLRHLGAGPYVYRYPPDGSDGFSGQEGAFLPTSAWAVSALAAVGRVEEARTRIDQLCAGLPRLLAEQVDPESGGMLGNVPLVWSHVELVRALYVLDAAERRRRWGAAGLWAWRIGRYVRLRLRPDGGDPADEPRSSKEAAEGIL